MSPPGGWYNFSLKAWNVFNYTNFISVDVFVIEVGMESVLMARNVLDLMGWLRLLSSTTAVVPDNTSSFTCEAAVIDDNFSSGYGLPAPINNNLPAMYCFITARRAGVPVLVDPASFKPRMTSGFGLPAAVEIVPGSGICAMLNTKFLLYSHFHCLQCRRGRFQQRSPICLYSSKIGRREYFVGRRFL